MKLIMENSDIRIDKELSNRNILSRSEIERLIKEGNILVNGKIVKPSYKVKVNDVIDINYEEKKLDIKPVDMKLNIVYEDDDIMVIDKPTGLVVHPGSGNTDNTLVNGLINYTNNLSDTNGVNRLGIVHRIDKDTSGLLLVAKNNKAHQILAEKFKNKEIKREYIALLCGVFKHDEATIDAPIGRDKLDRKKMTVTDKNSKRAVSHMKVLKRYKNYTLVKFRLETGRTHQIRVHAKYIGYPIFNDPVYNKEVIKGIGQFLHSYKMSFEHPIIKKELSFVSKLPDYFQNYLDELEVEDNF